MIWMNIRHPMVEYKTGVLFWRCVAALAIIEASMA